jgi:hypothetical protein
MGEFNNLQVAKPEIDGERFEAGLAEAKLLATATPVTELIALPGNIPTRPPPEGTQQLPRRSRLRLPGSREPMDGWISSAAPLSTNARPIKRKR